MGQKSGMIRSVLNRKSMVAGMDVVAAMVLQPEEMDTEGQRPQVWVGNQARPAEV